MDSLTQIVLGAATGEIAGGRKLGNRAMLYGAIGGTIPDLDVLANFVTDEMTALAFHRASSHSFFFAFTAPLILGGLTHWLYRSDLYRRRGFRIGMLIFWSLLFALMAFGVNAMISEINGGISAGLLVSSVAVTGLLIWWLSRFYLDKNVEEVKTSFKLWYGVFFLSIFTHPLLDCCTTYGTQVFQPFSDYRVGFNNISVVDPIYTLPFLICVFIASRLMRQHSWRKYFVWLGIGLSSAYLAFTVYNKHRVNQVMEKSLAAQNITYQRYMTSPTIFNNILWNCVAEGDTAYYIGYYSFYDKKAEIPAFFTLPKSRHLLKGYEQDDVVTTLKWFTNDYYNVIENDEGKLQINDLRFGYVGTQYPKPNDFVFRFILEEENGKLNAHQTRENSFQDGGWETFTNRMLGKVE